VTDLEDLEGTHVERSYLETYLNRSAEWCSLIREAPQVFMGIGAYFIGIYTWEWEFEGGKRYSVVFYVPNGWDVFVFNREASERNDKFNNRQHVDHGVVLAGNSN
jgi:hypothetical protein